MVDVPAESFYELITDFGSYPDFLDNVVATEVLRHDGDVYYVKFTIRVIKQFDYVLRLEGTPYERLTWHLTEPGLFQSNDGGWRIESLTDSSIRAHYALSVVVSRFVPKTVTRRLTQATLPEMLSQWKTHAESLYRAENGGDR